MLRDKLLSTGVFYENEYFDQYISLIQNKSIKEPIKYKTQRHHILPRSYFNYYSLEIDNSEDNIAILYHKDHVLAHVYLALSFSNKYLASASKFAVFLALRNPNGIANEQYLLSEDLLNDLQEYDQLMQIRYVKGPMSDASKKKLSEALTGRCMPEKAKQAISKFQKSYWKLLHKQPLDDNIRKKIAVSVSDYNQYMKLNHPDQWKERNNLISMKVSGLKRSKEFCENMSISRTGEGNPMYGKHHTDQWKEEHSHRMSGEGNPFFGMHHSEETKQKAVNTRKENGSYGPRKFINNGIENKFIKLDEISKYLTAGWVLGKLYDRNKK